MSKHLTPKTRAEWRKDAEQATYYGGVEQEQADLALLDALDEAERERNEARAEAATHKYHRAAAYRALARVEALRDEWKALGYGASVYESAAELGDLLTAALAGTDPTDTEGDDRD